MSNLAEKLLDNHEHKWHEIIEVDDSGQECIMGYHCFTCGETNMLPKLVDIGTPVEVTQIIGLTEVSKENKQ